MNLPSPRLYSLAELRRKIQYERVHPRPHITVLSEPEGLLYTSSEGADIVVYDKQHITNFDTAEPFVVLAENGSEITLQSTSDSDMWDSRARISWLHPAENLRLYRRSNPERKRRFRWEYPHQYAAMKAYEYEHVIGTPSEMELKQILATHTKYEQFLLLHALDETMGIDEVMFPGAERRASAQKTANRYRLARCYGERRANRPLKTKYIAKLRNDF